MKFKHNEKLSPEQIYNANEMGQFWLYVPWEKIAAPGENVPIGIKDLK